MFFLNRPLLLEDGVESATFEDFQFRSIGAWSVDFERSCKYSLSTPFESGVLRLLTRTKKKSPKGGTLARALFDNFWSQNYWIMTPFGIGVQSLTFRSVWPMPWRLLTRTKKKSPKGGTLARALFDNFWSQNYWIMTPFGIGVQSLTFRSVRPPLLEASRQGKGRGKGKRQEKEASKGRKREDQIYQRYPQLCWSRSPCTVFCEIRP